ncbi:hypothetical protein GCM10023258_12330 [Terrabacter aeriphilus]|uniref:Uncharacterized protein n=1 Tax=Terrabacter aeriphilus TaxID=515662 RepID=A0ABP9J757_9MICO
MSGGGNLPVGPGIWGFVAFFVLAVALWLLVRNMNTRLRRMAYRDRERAEQFASDADPTGSGQQNPPTRPTESTQSTQSTEPTTPAEPTEPTGEAPQP